LEELRKWYVITTRSRAEKKVALGLSKIGVQHFLPLQKQLKQWKDRKKWVEIPLFGSYLFVYITERQKNDVFTIQGVIKFLSIKGRLSILSEEEIERIKKICAYEHEVRVSAASLLTSDYVEVIEGPLKGLKGRVSEKANNAYLYIQIENLGFTASFKIEKELVRRVI
jgi:transcriptional antiterminator RfaH